MSQIGFSVWSMLDKLTMWTPSMVLWQRRGYALPHKVHDLVLQFRGASDQLKGKLLGFKLKKINQYLLYDLKDIFDKKLRIQPNPPSFRAESKPKLQSWRNSKDESKVIPTYLVTKYLLPPWFSFYEKKANFDPNIFNLKKVFEYIEREKLE